MTVNMVAPMADRNWKYKALRILIRSGGVMVVFLAVLGFVKPAEWTIWSMHPFSLILAVFAPVIMALLVLETLLLLIRQPGNREFLHLVLDCVIGIGPVCAL